MTDAGRRSAAAGGRGPDPIGPPVARAPEQLCRLIADALGDGDLDAALSFYAPRALMCLPGVPPARGTAQIARALAHVVDAKLAFDVRVHRIRVAESVALLSGRWSAHGTPETGGVLRSGPVRSVLRRGRDGAWRVLVEDLADEAGPSP